jgi:hypothetical protein
MLMEKAGGRVSSLGGKWEEPTEVCGSRKRGAVMGEVEGEKIGRCGQRGCNVFLKHRSFSQKRGRFFGISRTFLKRRSEGDKRK